MRKEQKMAIFTFIAKLDKYQKVTLVAIIVEFILQCCIFILCGLFGVKETDILCIILKTVYIVFFIVGNIFLCLYYFKPELKE